MIQEVVVYGFGSAFRNPASANDVDLLILHATSRLECCKFAIECKKVIKMRIPKADVTMLSVAEAERFKFIEVSGAFRLGSIRNLSKFEDIENVVCTIESRFGILSVTK